MQNQISQNQSLRDKQEDHLDKLVVYLDSCHRKVIPMVNVPPEGYFNFIRGFDPIAYMRIEEIEKSVDTMDIEWGDWEAKLNLYKNEWVTLLRRVYDAVRRSRSVA